MSTKKVYIPVDKSKCAAKRKLSIEEAREIKRRLDIPESQASIARAFSVKPAVIYGIAEGLSYRDA